VKTFTQFYVASILN